MGATPADTQREITRLRGDMNAALDEVERRVARRRARRRERRSAHLERPRPAKTLVARARDNPTLLGVARRRRRRRHRLRRLTPLINGLRERNKPQNRLKRGVQQVREELSERSATELSRRQSRAPARARADRRGVLLKLEPEDGGYVRVSDARLEPLANKEKGPSRRDQEVHLGSVAVGVHGRGQRPGAARGRSVWRATVHEDPPTDQEQGRRLTSRGRCWQRVTEMLSADEIVRLGIVDVAASRPRRTSNPMASTCRSARLALARAGALGADQRRSRYPPERQDLAFDADGWICSSPAHYGIRYAEWVELPARLRRAVFSAFEPAAHGPARADRGVGRGLRRARRRAAVVANPHGVRLQRGARIAQLVLFRADRSRRGALLPGPVPARKPLSSWAPTVSAVRSF